MVKTFETSCFDARSIPGDDTNYPLHAIWGRGEAARDSGDDGEGAQLDLNLVTAQ
jgi:hypothetical protein